MPNVAELERLGALSRRLILLADMQRGEVIRAENWNSLASAVLELARVVLAEGNGDQVPEHEHVEEVDIGWLTPRLRSLIEKGGLSDPVAVQRLASIERDGRKLKEQIDDLYSELGRVRTGLTDVKIGDLDREADMTILRRKFEAGSDARDEVLALRKTLDEIEKNIDGALELGDKIRVDGEVPDLQDWLARLDKLEVLRKRLTNPDGTLLDASALAVRMAELENQFVKQDQLDEALEDVRTLPPQDTVNALETGLKGYVDEQLAGELDQTVKELDQRYFKGGDLDGRLDSLEADLLNQTTAKLEKGLADLQQQVVSPEALNDRLSRLTDDLRKQLDAQIPEVVDTHLDVALAGLDERFVSTTQLGNTMAAFYAETEGKLLDSLNTEIEQTVDGAVGKRAEDFVTRETYENDIAELSAAVGSLQEKNAGVDAASIASDLDEKYVAQEVLVERMADLEAAMLPRLEEQSRAQVEGALEGPLGDMRTQLEALNGIESRMNTMVSNQVNGVRQEMAGISRQMVQAEIQGLQHTLDTLQGQVASISNRVTAGIRDEVTAALGDLTADIQADLKTMQRQVSELDGRVASITVGTGGHAGNPVAPDIEPVDNLVEIDGLGEAFTERLLDKGIRTFGQLAALSDQELADILRTTESNVARWGIQDQAAAKAQK